MEWEAFDANDHFMRHHLRAGAAMLLVTHRARDVGRSSERTRVHSTALLQEVQLVVPSVLSKFGPGLYPWPFYFYSACGSATSCQNLQPKEENITLGTSLFAKRCVIIGETSIGHQARITNLQ